MDTKLKNIKYTTGAKAVAAILIWICFMCAAASGISLIYFEDTFNVVTRENYFDTYYFKRDYASLVHNVVELNVILKSEQHIKAPILEELKTSNNTTPSGESEAATSATTNSVSANDTAVLNEDEVNLASTEEMIVEKLERFRRIQQHLSENVNFVYYMHNTETQDVFTNIAQEDALKFIQSQSTARYFNHWEPNSDFPLVGDIRSMLTNTSYEVYTAVLDEMQPGDAFYNNYTAFNQFKAMEPYLYVLLIASFIILIIALIYLIYVSGRREKYGAIQLSFVDKTYTDVHLFLVIVSAILSFIVVNEIYRYVSWNHDDRLFLLGILAVFGLDAWIGLTFIFSMIRQFKNKQIIKNSLLYKVCMWVISLAKIIISNKMFKPWILILLLFYGIINGIFFAQIFWGTNSFFAFLLATCFNMLALYFASKFLVSLTEIMKAAKAISKGNLDYELSSNKISTAFSTLVTDIQSIQSGLKKAVEEAVKSERMKTDLITNVSHDLKTPLTSIITYVDLLKNEPMHNDTANDYICILEEKSIRLKQLIEDLIEASKASSGNLILKSEKIDLHELILQACGEYEEKFKANGLDIRISKEAENIAICADGQYMWRIIENIFSNVSKYSLPNTRVYIEITLTDTHGQLIIKNISSCPLDVSPEQLTERFVRGDASRATEGSGLGLSIAESLTKLQKGKFDIQIDGDLFKTIVSIPLWKNN